MKRLLALVVLVMLAVACERLVELTPPDADRSDSFTFATDAPDVDASIDAESLDAESLDAGLPDASTMIDAP